MNILTKLQFQSSLSTLLPAGVGLIQAIIILRILTPKEFGFIGIVMSVFSIASMAGHFGIDSATTREIAAVKETKDKFKVFVVALIFKFIILSVMALFLYIYSDILGEKYHDTRLSVGMRIVVPLILIQGLSGVLESALWGLQKFHTMFLIRIVRAFLSLGFFVSLTYFFRMFGYLYALLGVTFLTFCIELYFLAPVFKPVFRLPEMTEVKSIFRRIIGISTVVYFNKIMNTIWLRAGTLVLGLYSTKTETGYFSASINLTNKLAWLPRGINTVSLPFLTSQYSNEGTRLLKVFRMNFLRIFSLYFFICSFLLLFSKDLISFLLGKRYLGMLESLPYVLFGLFLYFVANFISTSLLFPTKKIKKIPIATLCFAVSEILLAFVLIKRGWGSKGAGIAFLFSSGILFLGYSLIAWLENSFSVFNSYTISLLLIFMALILVFPVLTNIFMKILVFLLYTLFLVWMSNKFEVFQIKRVMSILRRRL